MASLLALLAFTVASSLVGLLTLWRHSEAERGRADVALARAVESDRATSVAMRELLDLLAQTVDAPQMMASERLEMSSLVVRDLTSRLRRGGHFAASNVIAACRLERALADALRSRGREAHARILLLDSLELLEARREAADESDIDDAYASTLLDLGGAELEWGRLDAAQAWVDRAEAALEELVHDPRRLNVIVRIDGMRRSLARQFRRDGQEGRRRKLLEDHLLRARTPWRCRRRPDDPAPLGTNPGGALGR